jgi:hypothetical protein
MNYQSEETSLIQQLENLLAELNESTYVSREGRLKFSEEIEILTKRLNEGEISQEEGENSLMQLSKKVAQDEITFLSSRIKQLNPSSPRLEALRTLENDLHTETISATQARKKLQELMNGSPS